MSPLNSWQNWTASIWVLKQHQYTCRQSWAQVGHKGKPTNYADDIVNENKLEKNDTDFFKEISLILTLTKNVHFI